MTKIIRIFGKYCRVVLHFNGIDDNKTIYHGLVFVGGQPLWGSIDYRAPSNWSDDKKLAGFLEFALQQPGDTDADFFKNHSPEYLQWLSTPEADEIRLWADDIENHEQKLKDFLNEGGYSCMVCECTDFEISGFDPDRGWQNIYCGNCTNPHIIYRERYMPSVAETATQKDTITCQYCGETIEFQCFKTNAPTIKVYAHDDIMESDCKPSFISTEGEQSND